MTEEEIQALKEAKEAAEAAAEAAKEEAEKAKSDLTGVVDELKDVRAKKQEAESKLESINNPNPEPEPGAQPSVEDVVKQALAKQEQERIKNEMESAVEEFRNSKTEFQSDTSGIVFEKFKKDLGRFNFSDINSKAEAKQRLEEAYEFIRRKEASQEGGSNYEGSSPAPNTPPSDDKALPQDVKSTLDSQGIQPERFNKLNDKYSDALAGLGFGR